MVCINRKCKDWDSDYGHNDFCSGCGIRYNGNACKDYIYGSDSEKTPGDNLITKLDEAVAAKLKEKD